MRCRLLVISLAVLLSITLTCPVTFACDQGTQGQDGGQDSGSADSDASGGQSSAGSGGTSGQSGGSADSSNSPNGPDENPCQYYWNWGSSKYHCKPPFGD